jgi:hypothetical protein
MCWYRDVNPGSLEDSRAKQPIDFRWMSVCAQADGYLGIRGSFIRWSLHCWRQPRVSDPSEPSPAFTPCASCSSNFNSRSSFYWTVPSSLLESGVLVGHAEVG